MAQGRGTVNKVILIGRLGVDPELKYTPSGRAYARFSLATNRVWKDQEGNKQEKTDWHKIVAWGKLAEIMGEWLKKGRRVYIEGRIETRSFEDKNGARRWITEVVADNLEMLGDKGADTSSDVESPPPEENQEEDDLPF